jgi:type IX secretion system PorP/SprF family membrane protein
MRKLFFLLIINLLTGLCLEAQVDPHFTQYYAYPLWLNSGLTGVIDGEYRVGINYRQQLPGLYAPMNTKGISAEIALPKNFGLGITLLNQTSADAGYAYTTGYLSLAYRVHIGKYRILSAGFQFGMLNRKIDPGKLQFGNQFNPVIGYDASLPSNELFTNRSATSADGSIGLFYFDGDPLKSVNPFIGASLYHPTQPNNRFLSSDDNNKIPMRYAVHGGIRFKIGNGAELIPHAVFIQQGNINEIAGGMICNLKVQQGTDLVLGGMYRMNDAIAPTVGLHFNGLTIGVSYDINISQLKTASSSKGGYELSISFTNQKKIPDTKFICPRL